MTPWGDNLGDPGSVEPHGISGHIDDWGEQAVDYLDGRLSPGLKDAVEQHLANCPECASRMATQQGVIHFLQRTPLEETPEDLEDRVLGELLFPSHADGRPVLRPQSRETPRPQGFWPRFRPWAPVTAIVLAIFVGIVTFGVLLPGSGDREASVTTVAAADNRTESSPAQSPDTFSTAGGEVSTTAAAETESAPTTAASSGDTEDVDGQGATPSTLVITDKDEIVNTLEAAEGPAYIAFRATAKSAGESAPSESVTTTVTTASGGASESGPTETMTGTEVTKSTLAAHEVENLITQLETFTGLKPLSTDLSVDGPTFAAYIERKRLSQFLDLLLSIKSSLHIDLALRTDDGADLTTNAGVLSARKAEIPVLKSYTLGQPATSRYGFTTSTLVQQGTTPPPGLVTPDDEGTHALIVIFIVG